MRDSFVAQLKPCRVFSERVYLVAADAFKISVIVDFKGDPVKSNLSNKYMSSVYILMQVFEKAF